MRSTSGFHHPRFAECSDTEMTLGIFYLSSSNEIRICFLKFFMKKKNIKDKIRVISLCIFFSYFKKVQKQNFFSPFFFFF